MSTRKTKANPFAYGKPITLDTLPDLFAHHRGTFGGLRMDAGDGTGGGDGTGDNTGGTGNTGGSDAGGNTGTGTGDTGRTFTQADLDRVVQQRLGEATRKHEKALEDARADAGRSDTQRLEVERDRALERAEAAGQKAAPRVAQALAQVAAITAGGRADRAAAIVRQADLDGVAKFDGDDWTVDEAKVAEAIGKVLEEYPEWKADADAGKGKGGDNGDAGKGDEGKAKHGDASGGDLGGGRTGEVNLEAFQRMTMTERGKLAADDPEQYRRLADAEIDAKRAYRGR